MRAWAGQALPFLRRAAMLGRMRSSPPSLASLASLLGLAGALASLGACDKKLPTASHGSVYPSGNGTSGATGGEGGSGGSGGGATGATTGTGATAGTGSETLTVGFVVGGGASPALMLPAFPRLSSWSTVPSSM